MPDITNKNTTPPIALTIAGSDCSGGAGIQADLKTFMAHGVYGASAITALTAQNTNGVMAIHTPPAKFVRAQIDAVAQDLDIAATKIGMLANAEIAAMVAKVLDEYSFGSIVVDPVLVATSGDVLLERVARGVLKSEILPRADLVTPNLAEAAALTGQGCAQDDADLQNQGRALLSLGCSAVLIKGGHQTGDEVTDWLFTAEGETPFRAPRIQTNNTHGTGCTLAAAITSQLALGLSVPRAIENAKTYVSVAVASGAQQQIGTGNGPIDHMVAAPLSGVQGKKTRRT